jgi:hypothetical protein
MKGNQTWANGCSTFQRQESVLKDIIEKINQAKGALEKAKFAEELQKEANVLSCCLDYDQERSDCKNCHFIANLRIETSNLIMKIKKIACD